MKRLKVFLTALALALVTAAPALAQDREAKDRTQSFTGTVDSIDHHKRAIAVNGQRFELSSESLVVLDKGNESDLEEVAVGDYVALEYEVMDGEPSRSVVTLIRK